MLNGLTSQPKKGLLQLIKIEGKYMGFKERIILKLNRIASGCSERAGKDLHPLNDDLIPWLETNEDISEYLDLLDTLTLVRW